MIDKVFYNKKMDEAIELMGSHVKKKTLDLIYEKIRHNYENSDLEEALNTLVTATDKLTFHVLVTNLNKYASMRREKERQKERLAEKRDAKAFWHKKYDYSKQGTCNRKCTQCPVEYCDIIAAESMKAIKALLNKEKTLKQVNAELSAKFDIPFGKLRICSINSPS